MLNPKTEEFEYNPRDDSQSEGYDPDSGEESEKEPMYYSKLSSKHRRVKIEQPCVGRHKSYQGSDKKTCTPENMQDASKIITFLKSAILIFIKKESMSITDHLDAYENVLSILGLDDDQSRIHFLIWVLETKYCNFFESSKSL